MNLSRVVGHLSALVVVSGLVGCAAQQTAVSEAPEQVQSAAREPGLVEEPRQPLSVPDLVSRLSDGGRATYSVASNSYVFYVGGDVSAEYLVTDETLVVSDVAGSGESCNFSADGALLGEADDEKAQAKLAKYCEGLVERLSGYFAQ